MITALTLGVIAIDLLTKYLAVSRLEGRESVRLLGGAVYLVLTRNSGAAFSLGSNVTYIFPIVAIVVVCGILWMARRVASLPWAVAFGLVLGGAVGNLIDRIFRAPGPFLGHVVDFISVFNARGDGFPVFNVADSALCVGVGLAVLLELTGRRREGGRIGADADGTAERATDGGGTDGGGTDGGGTGGGGTAHGAAKRPVGDVTDSARAGD